MDHANKDADQNSLLNIASHLNSSKTNNGNFDLREDRNDDQITIEQYNSRSYQQHSVAPQAQPGGLKFQSYQQLSSDQSQQQLKAQQSQLQAQYYRLQTQQLRQAQGNRHHAQQLSRSFALPQKNDSLARQLFVGDDGNMGGHTANGMNGRGQHDELLNGTSKPSRGRRSRSSSLDRALSQAVIQTNQSASQPQSSMDPTGMFRNRGRHVVASGPKNTTIANGLVNSNNGVPNQSNSMSPASQKHPQSQRWRRQQLPPVHPTGLNNTNGSFQNHSTHINRFGNYGHGGYITDLSIYNNSSIYNGVQQEIQHKPTLTNHQAAASFKNMHGYKDSLNTSLIDEEDDESSDDENARHDVGKHDSAGVDNGESDSLDGSTGRDDGLLNRSITKDVKEEGNRTDADKDARKSNAREIEASDCGSDVGNIGTNINCLDTKFEKFSTIDLNSIGESVSSQGSKNNTLGNETKRNIDQDNDIEGGETGQKQSSDCDGEGDTNGTIENTNVYVLYQENNYNQESNNLGDDGNICDDNYKDKDHNDSDCSSNSNNNSTIGSTVSIMGSVAGDGEYGYDEAKLLAVRRRMIQDVNEILEETQEEENDGENNQNVNEEEYKNENSDNLNLEKNDEDNATAGRNIWEKIRDQRMAHEGHEKDENRQVNSIVKNHFALEKYDDGMNGETVFPNGIKYVGPEPQHEKNEAQDKPSPNHGVGGSLISVNQGDLYLPALNKEGDFSSTIPEAGELKTQMNSQLKWEANDIHNKTLGSDDVPPEEDIPRNSNVVVVADFSNMDVDSGATPKERGGDGGRISPFQAAFRRAKASSFRSNPSGNLENGYSSLGDNYASRPLTVENYPKSMLANGDDDSPPPLSPPPMPVSTPTRATRRTSPQYLQQPFGKVKGTPPGAKGMNITTTTAATTPANNSTTTQNQMEEGTPTSERITASSLLPIPFQIARKCFSFEDTTTDDDHFLMTPDQMMRDRGTQSSPSKYYGLSAVASFPDEDDDAPRSRIFNSPSFHSPGPSGRNIVRPKWHPPHRSRLDGSDNPFRVIRESQSWDLRGYSPNVRSRSNVRNKYDKDENQNIRQASSFEPFSPFKSRPYANSAESSSRWLGRNRPRAPQYGNGNSKLLPASDSLPLMEQDLNVSTSLNTDKQNKEWEKIRMERDDALDLLTCIVEQNLNFNQTCFNQSADPSRDFTETENDNTEPYEFTRGMICEKCQIKHDSEGKPNDKYSFHHESCESCLAKMKLIVNSIKETSALYSDHSRDVHSSVSNHAMRSNAVDLLMRSYEFILEMKRASLSANNWLKSVGWTKGNFSNMTNSPDDRKDAGKSDRVALKAMLHSAEFTIANKQDEINRLNEELSQCKAEIGRLKSSSRTQPPQGLISTERSILSNSSSEDDYFDDVIKKGADSLVLSSPRPRITLSESRDESFAMFEKKVEADMNLECRKEIIFLKAALEKANRTISALHSRNSRLITENKDPFESEIEPINASDDSGVDQPNNMHDNESEQIFMKIADEIENGCTESPGSNCGGVLQEKSNGALCIVKLTDPALEKELEEYRIALLKTLDSDPPNEENVLTRNKSLEKTIDEMEEASKSNSSELGSDQRMVNVRMIDGENFVTEWGDIVPPLPPPPDHGLRSPIVDAILSRWTEDSSMQSALLSWIENVLNGSKPESIPSLKLSSLDHQVRDGFTMHVLPLLLRRKDVHVHVTTRALRQTTYDIAVSISHSVSKENLKSSISSNDAIDGENTDHCKKRSQSFQNWQSFNQSRHLMAFQATRSGTITKESEEDHGMELNSQDSFSPMQFSAKKWPGFNRGTSHTKPFSDAGSISTAVTSPMSNRTPSKARLLSPEPGSGAKGHATRLISDGNNGMMPLIDGPRPASNATGGPASLGDDLSVGSTSVDDSESKQSFRQSSLISSLGDAFGGFLSRRKPSNSAGPDYQRPTPRAIGYDMRSPKISGTSYGEPQSSTPVTPQLEAGPYASKSPYEYDHPYHRVVSAPPGKIGLTFIEYRGHALVSDVAQDSPLAGWVFPSDILIAIDDIPVSGLRTRDIVKLLNDKRGRQRALRMISSHAMNELIRPGAP